MTTFDGAAYLASYGDLRHAFGQDSDAALQHYIDYGWHEGRTITFDSKEYLASNLDLLSANIAESEAAWHYIRFGINEGRSINSFDATKYLSANADIKKTFGDASQALQHYIAFGWKENRPLEPSVNVPPTTVVSPPIVVSPPVTPFVELHGHAGGSASSQGWSASSFPLQKGQSYQADVVVTGSSPSRPFNPLLQVGYWHQTGPTTGYLETLASDDDSGGALQPKLIFTAPATGLFMFQVTSSDGSEGVYTMTVNSI